MVHLYLLFINYYTMWNIDLVPTSGLEVQALLSNIELERAERKQLIEDNITSPSGDDEILSTITTFVDSLWLEMSTSLLQNSKKKYCFVRRPWAEKNLASIWVRTDSLKWTFQPCWSIKSVSLWYADLNSPTGFTKFTTEE